MARSYKELEKDLNFKYYPATERKYSVRVLMVHFFGGNQRLISRHIKVLNDMGLDVYGFDFTYVKGRIYKKIPKSFKKKDLEIQSIWNGEVVDALSYVPGPVVMFSFSGPAACSIHAAVNDPLKKVVGFISDSGPFTHIFKCGYNLAKVEFGFKSNIGRAIATTLFTPLWNWNHSADLISDLEKLPVKTPYLSIQPVLDEVVPVEYLSDVFARAKHKTELTTVRFEESGHLNALKKQPARYKDKLSTWFKKYFS